MVAASLMAGHAYCTYFDHRYLARGLAMFASLRRHDPGAPLWVLCLSEECRAILEAMALPGLEIVPLSELEAFDPALAASRGNRSPVEYYFTCSPCFPRLVMARAPDIELVTYLDSDLYFFSSPAPILDELGDGSVAITPHRFTPRSRRSHGRFGEYNVGWVSFRRDRNGLACLEWWRERCIEWCHDRVEGARYADQKYLEQFDTKFSGVWSLRHPGVNLAPWNLAGFRIDWIHGKARVNDLPLVFFHFQGLKPLAGGAWDSNLTGYGARMSPAVRDGIFLPYLAEIARVESELSARGLLPPDRTGIRRAANGFLGRLRAVSDWLRTLHARLVGNVVNP